MCMRSIGGMIVKCLRLMAQVLRDAAINGEVSTLLWCNIVLYQVAVECAGSLYGCSLLSVPRALHAQYHASEHLVPFSVCKK